MDKGAWRATVHGFTQRWTLLKWPARMHVFYISCLNTIMVLWAYHGALMELSEYLHSIWCLHVALCLAHHPALWVLPWVCTNQLSAKFPVFRYLDPPIPVVSSALHWAQPLSAEWITALRWVSSSLHWSMENPGAYFTCFLHSRNHTLCFLLSSPFIFLFCFKIIFCGKSERAVGYDIGVPSGMGKKHICCWMLWLISWVAIILGYWKISTRIYLKKLPAPSPHFLLFGQNLILISFKDESQVDTTISCKWQRAVCVHAFS